MRRLLTVLVLAFTGDPFLSCAAPDPPLPTSVDLRPEFERWGLAPRRQGGRPTCSAFTVAGALEFAAARRQGHGDRLSVEFLNWAANKTGNDTNDGGFFSDLWDGYAAYGICAETNLPYAAKFDPLQQPAAGAMADAKTRLELGLRLHWIKPWDVNTGLSEEQFLKVKQTLSQGWPVCGGFRWPKREQWVSDVLQLCPSNAVRDGHSVLLVGYRDEAAQPGGGVFLFRNTSRASLTNAMPYAYAIAYMNDAAWVDHAPAPKPTGTSASPSPLSHPRPGGIATLPAGGDRRIPGNGLPKWREADLDNTSLEPSLYHWQRLEARR